MSRIECTATDREKKVVEKVELKLDFHQVPNVFMFKNTDTHTYEFMFIKANGGASVIKISYFYRRFVHMMHFLRFVFVLVHTDRLRWAERVSWLLVVAFIFWTKHLDKLRLSRSFVTWLWPDLIVAAQMQLRPCTHPTIPFIRAMQTKSWFVFPLALRFGRFVSLSLCHYSPLLSPSFTLCLSLEPFRINFLIFAILFEWFFFISISSFFPFAGKFYLEWYFVCHQIIDD